MIIQPEELPPNMKPAFDAEKQEDKRVPGANKKKLPLHMNAESVKAELEELKDVQFLHFTNMVDVFLGFSSEERSLAQQFAKDNSVDPGFGDEWCCTVQGPMRYDFLGKWKSMIH